MNASQEIELLNDIKRIEKELYVKQSQLASCRAMEGAIDWGTDKLAWKEEFDALIQKIGELSCGGNSVVDIRRERK